MATVATLSFDTLAFVKKLEARGATPELAEGIAEALKDANLVTRSEIEAAGTITKLEISNLATKVDLEKLRTEFKTEIAPLKWMVGVATAGIISLMLKAFF